MKASNTRDLSKTFWFVDTKQLQITHKCLEKIGDKI